MLRRTLMATKLKKSMASVSAAACANSSTLSPSQTTHQIKENETFNYCNNFQTSKIKNLMFTINTIQFAYYGKKSICAFLRKRNHTSFKIRIRKQFLLAPSTMDNHKIHWNYFLASIAGQKLSEIS